MLTQRLKAKFVVAMAYLLISLLSFNAEAINYSYDNLGRLTNVSYDNGNKIDYAYDSVGNLLSVSTTAVPDVDIDGIPDNTDNCPTVSNADQTNTDNDNLGNACDLDDDNDGMSDAYEKANNLNSLVNDAGIDTDNDGLTNIQEYQMETDPNNRDTDADGIIDGKDSEPLIKNEEEICFPIKSSNGNIVMICL